MNYIKLDEFITKHDVTRNTVYQFKRNHINVDVFKTINHRLFVNEKFLIDRMEKRRQTVHKVIEDYYDFLEKINAASLAYILATISGKSNQNSISMFLSKSLFVLRIDSITSYRAMPILDICTKYFPIIQEAIKEVGFNRDDIVNYIKWSRDENG